MNILSINLRGIRDDRKTSWIKGLKTCHGSHFVGIQESKLQEGAFFQLNCIWGRSAFCAERVPAEGRSGGLISIWDPSVFQVTSVSKNRYFLATSGVLIATGVLINVVNIYVPNDPALRRNLWEDLISFKGSRSGLWVLFGDFNDVRCPLERCNSEYVASNADAFNDFILRAGLEEYNMGGHKFTYMSDDGKKLSKLDRFLVCSVFRSEWREASVTALSCLYSDHSPIVLSIVATDFGHIPFRFFNSWLEIPGFVEYVAGLCENFPFVGAADLAIITKLKFLKKKIKWWIGMEKQRVEGQYYQFRKKLEELEKVADTRALTDMELESRTEAKAFVLDFERRKHMDLKQKARVKWATEGDENSEFFHGIINANVASRRINGVMVDGEWLTNPIFIKDRAFAFFEEKLSEPLPIRPKIICSHVSKLSDSEADMLVRPFSLQEIKDAVWECDGDKAPGPDGFNFRFLKRCWNGFQSDFIRLLDDFYHGAAVGAGCASSFIALVPKRKDPLDFKDYRPISLVGCVNKVLSKVLVARLKMVIGRLISPEQSAFLSGRNITDGPLILNEVLGG